MLIIPGCGAECVRCAADGCVKCARLLIWPGGVCAHDCPAGTREAWAHDDHLMGRVCYPAHTYNEVSAYSHTYNEVSSCSHTNNEVSACSDTSFLLEDAAVIFCFVAVSNLLCRAVCIVFFFSCRQEG